ncbi:TonB-dependent siderophore receptor [Undibacterium sp. RuTC16W]|uniref:TonB-dependent siderophore receptor n=1 Tax=Undibacterium sp. RuTC16W TaxID=3413048 RepID=UPI003BF0F89E
MKKSKRSFRFMKLTAGTMALLLSMTVHANPQSFNIQPSDLKTAIDAYIALTGQQIVYKSADLKGRASKGAQGAMNHQQALEHLLEGTDLQLRRDISGAIVIFRSEVMDKSVDLDVTPEPMAQVVVLGKALSHLSELARTGTRTDADPMTLPLAVTTVSNELIKQQQAFTLRDAVANVAGVSELNGDGSFSMRGFAAGVMRNGNLSVSGVSYDPPIMAVEKIEVVKGPEAIIAGVTTGYGGLINVITKTPQVAPITELASTVGSHGYADVEIDIGRALTQDKRWLARLVATEARSGDTMVGYKGPGKTYISPSLTWRDKQIGTEITTQYEYQAGRIAPPLETFAFGGALNASLPLYRYGPAENGTEIKGKVATVSFKQRLGENWTLSGQYTADRQRRDAVRDFTGLGTVFGLPAPEVFSFHLRNGSVIDTRTAKLELRGAIDTGPVEHKLLFAFDNMSNHITQYNQSLALRKVNMATARVTDITDEFGPMLGVPGPELNAGLAPKEQGALVLDQISWKQWVALLGLRQITYNPDQNSMDVLGELMQLLPSLGIVYRFDDEHSFYGNVSKGFVPNFGITSFGGNPVPPENAQQYEIGFKAMSLNRRVATTISLFDIRQKNVAVTDPFHSEIDCGGMPCYISVPGVRSRGAEVEVSGELTRQFGLRASYSYNTKDTGTTDQANVPYARHEGNLWAIYKFSDEQLGQWWLGAGANARSMRNEDQLFAHNPGQVRADLSAGYDNRNWSAIAGVKNVADKRLYTISSGVQGAAAVVQPRELYLTLRYKFD